MDFELYENEDGTEYAVLVSYGYGSGWSRGDAQLACDKRIVEFWLQHKDDDAFMKAIDSFYFGDNHDDPVYQECLRFFDSIGMVSRMSEWHLEHGEELPDNFVEDYYFPFMGGFADIELEWVPYGTMWRIDEYDGAESIEYFSPSYYNCFEKSA